MAEVVKQEGSQPVGLEDASTKKKGGFADSWPHAVLAYLATRRWPRFFGYGMLIVACRVVRTLIRA